MIEQIAENNEILGRIVGHTIVSARYDDSDSYDWGDHGIFTIVLDNGKRYEFTSTGYDASNVWIEEYD